MWNKPISLKEIKKNKPEIKTGKFMSGWKNK